MTTVLVSVILLSNCVNTQPQNTKPDESKIDLEQLSELELESENAVLRKQNFELRKEIDDLKNKHQNEVKALKDETAQYKELLISLEESYKKLQTGNNQPPPPVVVPDNTNADTDNNIVAENIAKEPEEMSLDVIFTPESSRAITVGSTENSPQTNTGVNDPKPKKNTFNDPNINPPPNPIKTEPIPFSKKMYDAAYSEYLNKNYIQAIQSFLIYLRRYPNAEYADNALFWLAMSYWSTQNEINAEKYFREILTKYAHGSPSDGFKSADALFMLGKIYENKNPDKSDFYYRKVTELFPDSVPAKIVAREIASKQNPQ